MTFGQGSGMVGTLYVGPVGPAAHFAELKWSNEMPMDLETAALKLAIAGTPYCLRSPHLRQCIEAGSW
jgi:hypothetical protein